MKTKENRLMLVLPLILTAAAILLCSCVKQIPDGGTYDVNGRETLFAPPETTSLPETGEITDSTDTTSDMPSVTTATPDTETTAEPETTDMESTENIETENPVFDGGFSGLY